MNNHHDMHYHVKRAIRNKVNNSDIHHIRYLASLASCIAELLRTSVPAICFSKNTGQNKYNRLSITTGIT